jgi:phosphoribosylanthranilate isomerase
VALFVEPTDDQVAQVVEHVGPDILQLYASPERVVALREMFGLPVWRGVGITGVDDLPETTEGADALLLESKPPADSTRPGGRAARFDWGVLTGWKPDFPWLLAGGLTPDNVAEAVHITGATVVDVSSGVESAPGVKDPALIRAFVHAARHR